MHIPQGTTAELELVTFQQAVCPQLLLRVPVYLGNPGKESSDLYRYQSLYCQSGRFGQYAEIRRAYRCGQRF